MDINYLEFEHEVSIFGSELYCVQIGPAHGIMAITETDEGELVLTNEAGETCTVDWDCVRTYEAI